MNELEMVTSKVCSAREILDSAIDRLQEHQYDKVETLLCAADEFLQYYLKDFDEKFKDAWAETVTKVKHQEIDDCMPPWGHSDLEYLSKLPPEEPKQDKVVKWQLPVEEVENGDTGETEYFITFPDDLLEVANLKPGDDVEWVDRNDGSFLLRKLPKTYDKELKDRMEELIDKAEKFYHKASHRVMSYQEAVDAGYSMTDDGFWIPPGKENDLYVSGEK